MLPMKMQRVKGIDKIEATRGRVALRRGPLIYNVEQADQDLDQVLEPGADLQVQWKEDLLHGVVVLTGSWSDGSALTAIPYFLRHNRSVNSPATEDDRRGRGSLCACGSETSSNCSSRTI